MNKKTIAKLMISTFDFHSKDEYIRLIEFLTLCMYHSDNEQKSSDIQNAIWYIVDRMNRE